MVAGCTGCACKTEELRSGASRMGMRTYGCMSGVCAGKQTISCMPPAAPAPPLPLCRCRPAPDRLNPCAPAGFRDFVVRGNVVDLAVAIVVGTSFTGKRADG